MSTENKTKVQPYSIFNAPTTQVVRGLEGKIILVYGSNSVGKTYQGTRMSKPLVLPFEDGLGAVDGVHYMSINSWSDFKKVNKELTSPLTVKKAREMYDTIIFDEVEASARMCREHICIANGANSIKEGNNGYGLWSEYETEYWKEINKLTKAGYTVYFIAHQDKDKDTEQIIPKGDKRSIDVIRDLADFTIFVRNNGVDESGKSLLSSGYFYETEHYFARSRFQEIVPMIREFTAENLEKAIIDAIEKEGKGNTISFDERVKKDDTSTDYTKIKSRLKDLYMEFQAKEKLEEYQEILENHLGVGATVSGTTEKQADILSLCVIDMEKILNQ